MAAIHVDAVVSTADHESEYDFSLPSGATLHHLFEELCSEIGVSRHALRSMCVEDLATGKQLTPSAEPLETVSSGSQLRLHVVFCPPPSKLMAAGGVRVPMHTRTAHVTQACDTLSKNIENACDEVEQQTGVQAEIRAKRLGSLIREKRDVLQEFGFNSTKDFQEQRDAVLSVAQVGDMDICSFLCYLFYCFRTWHLCVVSLRVRRSQLL